MKVSMGKSIINRIAGKISGKDIYTMYVSKKDMVNMRAIEVKIL